MNGLIATVQVNPHHVQFQATSFVLPYILLMTDRCILTLYSYWPFPHPGLSTYRIFMENKMKWNEIKWILRILRTQNARVRWLSLSKVWKIASHWSTPYSGSFYHCVSNPECWQQIFSSTKVTVLHFQKYLQFASSFSHMNYIMNFWTRNL
jgi:hypothetical protein